ncbi:MAG: hypothetical protein HY906_17710 [Deltaproteobacteria bacterium]|nr:hypothetical protein [Deltaproteobacteria bacterium]
MAIAAALAVGATILVAWLSGRSKGTGAAAIRPAADAGPMAVAEVEPNDTLVGAQPLPRLPAVIAGELGAADRDTYRVDVTDDGALLLGAWAEGPPGVRVHVWQADGRELAAVSAPSRIDGLGILKGRWFLVVEGGSSGVVGPYRLHAAIEPWARGLDWEPDDDPEQAQAMAALPAHDKEIARYRAWGRWSRPDDVDCYVVPLTVPPEGAMLRFDLMPPAGVRPHLWVLDAGNAQAKIPRTKLVEARGQVAGQALTVPALGARSWEASYVACVRAEEGFDPATRYSLGVRTYTPPGAFEFEPNDTKQTASALPRDTPLRGYLTEGDVDWLRISVGPRGEVSVRVEVPREVGAELTLLDGAGRELARAEGGGGGRLVARRADAVPGERRYLDNGASGSRLGVPRPDPLREAVAGALAGLVLVRCPDRLVRNRVHEQAVLDEVIRRAARSTSSSIPSGTGGSTGCSSSCRASSRSTSVLGSRSAVGTACCPSCARGGCCRSLSRRHADVRSIAARSTWQCAVHPMHRNFSLTPGAPCTYDGAVTGRPSCGAWVQAFSRLRSCPGARRASG